jgi:hypothetical protein
MFKVISDLYHKFSGLDKLVCSYPMEKGALLCPSPRYIIVFWHSPMTDPSIYVPILFHIFNYDTNQANYTSAMIQQSGDEGYIIYENSFEQCEHRMSLIDIVVSHLKIVSFRYTMRLV